MEDKTSMYAEIGSRMGIVYFVNLHIKTRNTTISNCSSMYDLPVLL